MSSPWQMVRRDLDRLNLPVPAAPFNLDAAPPGATPRTPGELVNQLPQEINATLQTALDLLQRLPGKLAEDLTLATGNLVRLPREAAEDLFQTPGQLAERLAPSNLNSLLGAVREAPNFTGVSDPRQARERVRTITSVVDLFTPT